MFAIVTENDIRITTIERGSAAASKRGANIANKIRPIENILVGAANAHDRFTGDVSVKIDGNSKSVEATFATDIADQSINKRGKHVIEVTMSHNNGDYVLRVMAPTVHEGMKSMIIGRNSTKSASFDVLRDTRLSVNKIVELFTEEITGIMNRDGNELGWVFTTGILDELIENEG